jgi:hypothetical protein
MQRVSLIPRQRESRAISMLMKMSGSPPSRGRAVDVGETHEKSPAQYAGPAHNTVR